MLKDFLLLLAGGLATSLAEFKLDYNLVDLVVDKFKAFFHDVENAIKKL